MDSAPGLMDVGVGSFVVANGVCGAEAESAHRNSSQSRRGTLSAVAPLLILGETLH